MLSMVNSTRQILPIVGMLFVATLFVGCGQVAPVSTATRGITPSLLPSAHSSLSVALSPVTTITQTATAVSLPMCTPLPVTYILVIDEAVYHSDAGIELGAI